MLALLVGTLAGLVVAIYAVFQCTDPGVWRVTGTVAAAAGYVAAVIVGTRMWATTPVRYELDEGGLRTFGADGELLQQVGWSEMIDYVIEPLPRSTIVVLRINCADGRVIRIVQGRTEEKEAAFRRFCNGFVSGAEQQQKVAPDTAIREGVGFYAKPGMRRIGTTLLVLSVIMVGLLFFLPDDGQSTSLRWHMVAVLAAGAPVIYRTVFAKRPVNGRSSPPRR